jgi:hypothetical protein
MISVTKILNCNVILPFLWKADKLTISLLKTQIPSFSKWFITVCPCPLFNNDGFPVYSLQMFLFEPKNDNDVYQNKCHFEVYQDFFKFNVNIFFENLGVQ